MGFVGGDQQAVKPVVKEKPTAAEKPTAKLIGMPLKKEVEAPGKKISKKQQILDLVNDLTEQNALSLLEVCKLSGLPASSVSPILSTLSNSGAIRSAGKPCAFKYYGKSQQEKKQEKEGGMVECKARGGKKIRIDDCNHNPNHDGCRSCDNG